MTVYGGGTSNSNVLNWEDKADNTDLEGGATYDMGLISAFVSFVDQSGGAATATVSDDDIFQGPENFDGDSSLSLFGPGGDGSAADATITATIDFSANAGSDLSDNITNVAFRINDLDIGSDSDRHIDIVTITAFDAAGNEVDVTLTAPSTIDINGGTATATGTVDSSPTNANSSLLVNIDGPVSKIVIEYANGEVTDQQILVSNITYDTLPAEVSNGIVEGTSGDDTMLVGFVDSDGDTIDGDDGDDDVIAGFDGDDSILGGAGDDVIYGGDIPGGVVAGRESFNWSEVPDPDNGGQIDKSDDFEPTFTQNTGSVDVTYKLISSSGSGVETDFEDDDQNITGIDGGTETVNENSAFESQTENDGETATYELGFSEEVANIDFRVNDVDNDSVLQILAFDAEGNPVEVSISDAGSSVTLSDEDSVAGNDTITSEGGNSSNAGEDHSALVEIAGPVARIQIIHTNDGGSSSHITVSDIFFDTLTSGTGADGNDTIDGGAGDDEIFGQAGDDVLAGGAGSNELYGGAGDDIFVGGDGADTFQGNEGQDNIDYSNSDAAVNVDLSTGDLSGGDAENDTIAGGIDGVVGTDFDDVLVGFDQQGTTPEDTFTNELSGGAGNDVIDGKGGDDLLEGGDDNDTITGGDGADEIYGGDDEDTIFAGVGDVVSGDGGDDYITIDPTQMGNGEIIEVIGGETDETIGDTLDLSGLVDDVAAQITFTNTNPDENGGLTGTATLNDGTIVNFTEIETIVTGNGTVDGTSGDDIITTTSGAGDTPFVDADGDSVDGDDGNDDVIEGKGGNDSIAGGEGADQIFGGDGDDSIAAGVGDTVSGDRGDDYITIDPTQVGDGQIIQVIGGEVGETIGDTLDLTGLVTDFETQVVFTNTNPDENGGLTGTATLDDGTIVNFTEIENVVARDITVDGTAGNDVITPTSGAGGGVFVDLEGDSVNGADGDDDIILGYEGDDTIDGGVGDDVIFAGADNDVATGNEGVDIVLGNEGADILSGGDSGDVIDGGSEDDTLSGEAGDDQLTGGTGNDDLTGGQGDDVLGGGEGDDTLAGNEGRDTLTGQAGDDSLDGGDNADSLSGGEGNDSILGGAGNDTIDTGAGNDVVDAGADRDFITGQAGDVIDGGELGDDFDTLRVTGPARVLYTDNDGNPSVDNAITENGTIEFLDENDVVTGTLEFTEIENLIIDGQGGLNGLVEGTDDAEIIDINYDGDPEGDFIDANDGTFGTSGDQDVVLAFGGDDEVIAGDAEDDVYGGEGNDELNGQAGNDNLIGGDGDDSLFGGEGDDFVFGDAFNAPGGDLNTSGNDLVTGGAGNDQVIGGSGSDTVEGGEGDDLILGGSGNALAGNPENLVLNASFENPTDVSSLLPGGIPTDFGLLADGSINLWSADNGTDQFEIHNDGRGGLTASDGNNWLDLDSVDGNVRVGQYIQGMVEGETYDFTFDAANSNGFSESANVYFGGELIATITPESGSFETFSFTLTAGSGDGRNLLEFEGLGEENNVGVAIDNVSILGESTDTGDFITGGAGNDTIFGEFGDDLIDGNEDDDFIDGGVGNDSLDAGEGDDTVFGGAGDDVLVGVSGNDSLFGGDGDDFIDGEADDDLIDGGAGNDNLFGGDGADSINGGAGQDYIEAGEGGDTVDAGADDDTVIGGNGDDSIEGGTGDDFIRSGNGNDFVFGGSGNDTISGSPDANTLFGGDDRDTFIGAGGGTIVTNPDGSLTVDNGTLIDGDEGGDDFDTLNVFEFSTITFTDENGVPVPGGTITVNFGDTIPAGIQTEFGVVQARFQLADGTIAESGAFTFRNIESINIVSNDRDGIVRGDFNGVPTADLIDLNYTGDNDGDFIDNLDGIGADGTFLDDDRVLAGDLDDTVISGLGNDIVDGESGNDTLILQQGSDIGRGGIGNDTIDGGVGDDQLFGGEGNDSLIGNFGEDRIEGGDGNDSATGDVGADEIFGGLGDDTLSGGFDDDTVDGGEGNDTLEGNFGQDRLFGQAGADILSGGGDNDSLFGGDDDDTLFGNAGDDFLDGGLGNDTLDGGDSNDSILGGEGNDFIMGGTGDDDINTGIGNNTVLAGTGDDTIIGLGGDDSIMGGSGDDFIDAGEGTNTIDAGRGDNTVISGSGNDVLIGLEGNDTLDGGAGDDTIFGGGGNDSLIGGEGNDQLDGGAGDDTLDGGEGNDSIFGGLGDDSVDGGGGDDFIISTPGEDVVVGGSGNDTIFVGEDNDTVFSGTGNDTVFAGSGDDSILGADGDDTLFGGGGNDSIDGGNNADVIFGDNGTGNTAGTETVATSWNALLIGGSDDLDTSENTLQTEGSANPPTLVGTTFGSDSDPVGSKSVRVIANDADGDGVVDRDNIVAGSGNSANEPLIIDGIPQELDTVVLYNATITYEDGTTATFVATVFQTVDGNVYLAPGETAADTAVLTAGPITSITIDSVDTDFVAGVAPSRFDTTFLDSSGGGDDNIQGNNGNDTIFGQGGNDTIDGGAGNDIIEGGLGNDSITGGSQSDTLFGGEGDDTVLGGDSSDTIFGDLGNDQLFGNEDDDTFIYTSEFGIDVVTGGELRANGTLDNDTLDLSGFTDSGVTLNVSTPEAGTITTNAANTDGITFTEIENILLTDQDDTATGSTGDDIIGLGAGADVINAGQGNDVINLGTSGPGGNDGVTDTIILNNGDGNDIIFNFDGPVLDADGNPTQPNDVFDVSSFTNAAGDPITAFDVVVTSDAGGNAVITFPDGTSQTLFGISATQVDDARELNAIGIPCFTKGTMIVTECGEIAIEDLRAGDKVLTKDNGLKEISWIGSRHVAAEGKFAPIMIKAGAMSNDRDLMVSPLHRMVVSGWKAELLFGAREVLVSAKHLTNSDTIYPVEGGEVTYYHMMFDQHEIVFANGAASESFHPGAVGMNALETKSQEEIYNLFPELRSERETYGPSARLSLKSHEAEVLVRNPDFLV